MVTTRSMGPDPHLTLTLDSVVRRNGHAWLRYAHLHTGSRDAAMNVMRATATELGRTWPSVLRQPSVAAHIRKVFTAQVERWLVEHDRGPRMPETAAFQAAVRKMMLWETQGCFALLESRLGLYSAISDLPEQQYDVIVLRFVLQESIEDIAEYLGITTNTVSTNIRAAKENLTRRLSGVLHTEERVK
ncbi:RNA polymerase sigma factor [Streptantibioticus silvisoli]|uniref:Sigma-70 family RNA polymerase sigma factor n=1 Tax=Streptantibioticus silvisoli TaxID=2705255 RepID=A0ABT6W2H5_9ACTN|nr:sigma-70 family RNA polymerase sigma factor [Streptantibioticus silvisoli]MDI5964925.1 sigma-70 family RNA polymerase sigma factor [Streptantibioticus silvisoli]